ncbi:MAG: DUF5050 domain-containing protein [Calditrichaeota bacterium]|nr:DUF5050 domain-containing protein [Calditrichota bacterium]HQU72033.1 DUF5050 domain-containing protein [Calditrichia bacterium]
MKRSAIARFVWLLLFSMILFSFIQPVFTQTADKPGSLSKVMSSGKVYWTSTTGGHVARANLDGSEVETLITGQGLPSGIALDYAEGKIYWVERLRNRIQRSNMDGSSIEAIVSGLESPYGLAIDTLGRKMYWYAGRSLKIQRSNLDGTAIEDIVTGGRIGEAGELHIDANGQQIYWTNWGSSGSLMRAGLDGSNVTTLLSNIIFPYGIDIDYSANKIYWIEIRQTDGKIWRCNLDGSEQESVITGISNFPNDLAIDVEGGKMYWTHFSGSNVIERANLDGTEQEILVTGISGSEGIALDLTTVVGLDPSTSTPAESFELYANYPNPFNPETHIEFNLSRAGQVRLEIFNVAGEMVALLLGEWVSAGRHQLTWQGRDQHGRSVPSGVYFCRLSNNGQLSKTRKMILLR